VDNNVFVWGTLLNTIHSTPTQVDTSQMIGKKIVSISSGNAHTLFLTENGQVYGLGYNNNYQLQYGVSNFYSPALISNMPRGIIFIRAIKAYGTTSLAITSSGQLLMWGSVLEQSMRSLTLVAPTINVARAAGYSDRVTILSNDGIMYTAGRNYNGLLGRLDVPISGFSATFGPVNVTSNVTVIDVTSADSVSLAMTSVNSQCTGSACDCVAGWTGLLCDIPICNGKLLLALC
jgi:alpha-tubulin suppressor-like RCC1 family protein